MAYTQQQITDEVNRILSSGGSWADVQAEANQYGVPASQLPPDPQAAQAPPSDWLSTVQQFGNLSNLPPDLWSQLQGPDASSVTYDGYRINPVMGNTGSGGENNYTGGQQVQSYSVTPDSYSTQAGGNIGQTYAQFDAGGGYAGNDTLQGFTSDDSFGHWLGLMGLAAGALYGGTSLLGAGSAGSTAASSLGTNGAFLGEDIASGVPAWDAAATNAGLTNGAFLGEDAASGIPAWDAAATNAGLTNGGAPATFTFNQAADSQAANDALGLHAVTDATDPALYLPQNDPTIFNAAKDSQLANDQLGLGPTPPAIPTGTGLAPVTPGTNGGLPPAPAAPPGGGGIPSIGSIADWTKLLAGLTTAITGLNGTHQTQTPAPTPAPAPFDYGPARYMPPGWRTDRPMYVPGQDQIPEGWLGAGGTSNA